MTGGNSHTDEEDLLKLAQSGEVYRDALSATRAVLPFWFWLVFLASIALVSDVAVRRISFERQEVALGSTRLWRRLRTGASEPQTTGDANLDRLLGRKRRVGESLDADLARKRFTPTGAPGDAPAPAGAAEFAARPSSPPLAPPPGDKPAAPAEDADDPLARLRKARDRAREQQRRDGAG